MLSVMDGSCSLLATTWEWKEDIDLERAEQAKKEAEEKLAKSDLSKEERSSTEAKLRRALVRISVKQ